MTTPIEQYLNTSYHPDREFVDGLVVERNLGEIFKNPPHLCIEVLSKDDTMDSMQEKIDDYLRFGVPYIWIVNPRLRKGYVATKAGMVEAESGVLETSDPDIRVPVAELFE